MKVKKRQLTTKHLGSLVFVFWCLFYCFLFNVSLITIIIIVVVVVSYFSVVIVYHGIAENRLKLSQVPLNKDWLMI